MGYWGIPEGLEGDRSDPVDGEEEAVGEGGVAVSATGEGEIVLLRG